MAKTRISEYDAIAANNTDVNSINIAEGCAPSGINNAIRQVMADLKDFQQGTKGDAFLGPVSSSSLTLSSLTANRVLYTNGSKVVATSDNMQFDGTTTTLNALTVDAAFAANGGATLGNATGDALTINSSAVSIPNGLNFGSNNLVLSGGYASIGNSTPSAWLYNGLSVGTGSTNAGITIYSSSSTEGILAFADGTSGTDRYTGYINYNNTSNFMAFATNGASERMRIDSSGNVGIGISSPASKLHIGGNTLVPISNSYYCYTSDFGIGTPDSDSLQIFAGSGNGIRFGQRVSGTFTERMRIDSSGNLLVGGTTGGYRMVVTGSGSSDVSAIVSPSAVSGTYFFRFGVGAGVGTGVGTISYNGTGVNYTTASDYRLKENVAPMTGALAKVSALKPVTYTWKTDGSNGQGFIAHELAEVVPDCVTGEKDAVDAEGKPVYQGIDTSFLVGVLTASIQELKAIVDAQAERITVLENK